MNSSDVDALCMNLYFKILFYKGLLYNAILQFIIFFKRNT